MSGINRRRVVVVSTVKCYPVHDRGNDIIQYYFAQNGITWYYYLSSAFGS